MNNLILTVLFQLVLVTIDLNVVQSHGRLMEPPARGSRWRFNSTAPKDYNDNQGFCGGFYKQWTINGGKCGLCGNDYSDKIPRDHELGGIYGEGIIVKNYKSSNEINVDVLITANHKGYFLFDLCNLDENHNESEECFKKTPLELKTGGLKYILSSSKSTWFNTTVIIPKNLKCEHCVLRWIYITGNSWGICENQTGAIGCGPQENFRGCSDISISLDSQNYIKNTPKLLEVLFDLNNDMESDIDLN